MRHNRFSSISWHYDIELKFAPEVLDLVVDRAVTYKLGARGLRSLFETIMIDVMYQAPSMRKKRFVLTREFAEQQLSKSNFELLAE